MRLFKIMWLVQLCKKKLQNGLPIPYNLIHYNVYLHNITTKKIKGTHFDAFCSITNVSVLPVSVSHKTNVLCKIVHVYKQLIVQCDHCTAALDLNLHFFVKKFISYCIVGSVLKYF